MPGRQPGPAPGDHGHEAGAVVVAGYLHSGTALFRKAMEVPGGPAWLDAPGLVHTTYQLGHLWQRIDGRAGGTPQVSAMTRKGIRTLLQSMLIGRLAQEGASSWVAATSPSPLAALEFFAEVYDEAKFVCLHRNFDDFAASAIVTYRWGTITGGTGLDKFTMQYPWNPAAALTQYWIAHTAALLDFQRIHPDRCLRVRYVDLVEHPEEVLSQFSAFTGWKLRPPAGGWEEDTGPTRESASGTITVPRQRIPGELLGEVSRLMTELGQGLADQEGRSTYHAQFTCGTTAAHSVLRRRCCSPGDGQRSNRGFVRQVSGGGVGRNSGATPQRYNCPGSTQGPRREYCHQR